METNVDDIVFVRAADEKFQDPAYLAQFVGEYELAGQTGTIELRGGVLTAIVPGQPPYRLVPTREMHFDLEGMSGFFNGVPQDRRPRHGTRRPSTEWDVCGEAETVGEKRQKRQRWKKW